MGSTKYRVLGVPHVGTGVVRMLGWGACAVLAPFSIQHHIVGGTIKMPPLDWCRH